jgi:peroxiredoxin/uncharacterized membrane protein YphA (DoxX/SURF4 family)
MDTLLVLIRLVLAGVFFVAGFAKLADRQGSRKALEGFGVPASIAQYGGVALPLAEIAVAVLLLPTATAWYGGIGALVLLLAFIGGISYNMAKGNHPDCHCFGQIHSEPAGWSTLIRNGVLGAGALALVLLGRDWLGFSNDDAGYSLIGWIGDLTTWELFATIIGVVALAAIVIEGWLLVHLLGQNGRLLLRLDAIEEGGFAEGAAAPAPSRAAAPAAPPPGLPEGSPAPAFRLEGVYGETMTLDALRAQGKPVMLVFSDPGCGPCNALLPDLGKWQREHSSKFTLAIVSRGSADANKAKVTEHGLANVLLQKDREVSNAYLAAGTPSAVLVRPDGTIGSPLSGGAESIRNLVSRASGAVPVQPVPMARPNGGGQPQPRQAAPEPVDDRIGKPAPDFTRTDLDGNSVTLSSFSKDKSTLVLFWSPTCGFCKRMADELKAWEQKPPKNAPNLLIVTSGTVEANRELGLTSTTVIDQGFEVGRSFGASGTPSAVLIDKNGKIASALAVGQPGVMALATGKDPAKANGAPAPQQKAIRKGDAAPSVKLKDLDGQAFDLADQKNDTLLVFWNPGCGFCRRMASDLVAWEQEKPAGSPDLVFVSTGAVEANREFGLTSRILLDDGFATGRSFGATGTPSAVLIDKNGRVKSDVAVGAPGVLELAGASPVAGK